MQRNKRPDWARREYESEFDQIDSSRLQALTELHQSCIEELEHYIALANMENAAPYKIKRLELQHQKAMIEKEQANKEYQRALNRQRSLPTSKVIDFVGI
ncbi:hypothetical protein HYV11_00490 [Candidatus Dependentiae bacterium]|nr:hypothetical protein [Candidatus Dependentiae bacterium]